MEKAMQFVDNLYQQIINDAKIFDFEEAKKINTLKAYERLLASQPSSAALSIASIKYFWWVNQNTNTSFNNRDDLLDKISLSLNYSKLDNVDKKVISNKISQLRNKNVTLTELNKNLVELMKDYSGKITRDDLISSKNVGMDYFIVKGFYYLIMASPVLIIAGYMLLS